MAKSTDDRVRNNVRLMQKDSNKIASMYYEWRPCVACAWPILSRALEPMCEPCMEQRNGYN